jgi:tRNA(fMet)-specific endonuclease VapC
VNGSSVYILDSNTTGYKVSGRSRAARRSFKAEREQSTVAISVITQAGILFGLTKKPASARLRDAVEEFLATIQILAWDSNAAHAYGRLRARLGAAGKTLAAMDRLITAHAVSANAILVTRDKALQKMAAVRVVDWAVDL